MVLEKLEASEDGFRPGKRDQGQKGKGIWSVLQVDSFQSHHPLPCPARESNLEENVLMRIFNWASLPDRN